MGYTYTYTYIYEYIYLYVFTDTYIKYILQKRETRYMYIYTYDKIMILFVSKPKTCNNKEKGNFQQKRFS